jgi:hypothetical protein
LEKSRSAFSSNFLLPALDAPTGFLIQESCQPDAIFLVGVTAKNQGKPAVREEGRLQNCLPQREKFPSGRILFCNLRQEKSFPVLSARKEAAILEMGVNSGTGKP